MNYDAILVVSFGGPESKEEVIPFLENVLRGHNVPRERMLAVAEHYYHFEGKSPINQQTRDLIAALEAELEKNGPKLPIYWGNRNWHPLLTDTLRKMKEDGIRRAVAFVTSAYSSYSGCRQYREDIARAQSEVGPGAPEVDKLRAFFNHPGFIEATVERVGEALRAIPADARENVQIVYTAHSIPLSMANTSDYVTQLEEVRRLVSGALGQTNDALVYQSRSGAPGQPWLEPDILDYLREVKAEIWRRLWCWRRSALSPITWKCCMTWMWKRSSFVIRLGLPMTRAKTVGVHPKFIGMIRELILERTESEAGSGGAMGIAWAAEQIFVQRIAVPAPQRPAKQLDQRSKLSEVRSPWPWDGPRSRRMVCRIVSMTDSFPTAVLIIK